ncbi:MAG: 3-hydroxybutyryl-CoA dehydratase [Pseudohongiellaceae bacterium]
MSAKPRERFSKTLVFSESQISEFAKASGDTNPLHHDSDFASKSRYGGIIASGPQTSALLMGAVAAHFSRLYSMVGLEFSFFFRASVPAMEPLQIDWLVIRNSPTRSGESSLVELRGRLQTSDGRTAVGAKGKILVNCGSTSTPNRSVQSRD